MGKIIAAVFAGVGLLLVGLLFAAGGSAPVARAEPPRGGCTIQSPTGGGSSGGASSGHGPYSMQQRSAELSARQMSAARTVTGVGKGMDISKRGIAIALGTAMQESTLKPHNSDGYGVGLFMQQGSLYAGLDKTDPAAASRAFYEMLTKRVPNYDTPPWQGGPAFADAAQTVQASGAGAKYYAQWREWATALAGRLYDGAPTGGGGASAGSVRCQLGGGSGPINVQTHGLTVVLPERASVSGEVTFDNQKAATAATAALSYLGTPYAWGGGGPNGPSTGIRDGGVADAHGDYTKIGFDCSGLTEYAYAQAGLNLPGVSQTQQRVPESLPWTQAKPGDLLFYGHPAHHVAIYLGHIDGQHYMVEAPYSGSHVRVAPVRTGGDFTGTVVRPYTSGGAAQ